MTLRSRGMCFLFVLFLSCGTEKQEATQVEEIKEVTITPEPTPKKRSESILQPKLLTVDPDFSQALSNELRQYFVDTVPDTAEVQVIEENVVVEVGISDSQLKKWESEMGDEEQQEIAGDIGYYLSEFDGFLKGKVKTVKATQRYLFFKGMGSNRQLVDLEKDGLPGVRWDYIAFNTTREPKLALDLTFPDSAFVHYVNEDIVCSDILPEDTKDGPCARDGAAPIYIRGTPMACTRQSEVSTLNSAY